MFLSNSDSQHQLLHVISESNLGLNLGIQTVYIHIHHYHSKWIKQLEFIIHLRCEHLGWILPGYDLSICKFHH